MTGDKMIDCSSHGSVKWSGQCVCAACGRLWWLTDGPEEHSPAGFPDCVCGERLIPEDDGGNDFTGRAVCPSCYDHHFPQVPPELRGDA